jgi:hypothetical protein
LPAPNRRQGEPGNSNPQQREGRGLGSRRDQALGHGSAANISDPLHLVPETMERGQKVNIPSFLTAPPLAEAGAAVCSEKRLGQHSGRVETKTPGIGRGLVVGDPVPGEIQRGQNPGIVVEAAGHDAARVIGERTRRRRAGERTRGRRDRKRVVDGSGVSRVDQRQDQRHPNRGGKKTAARRQLFVSRPQQRGADQGRDYRLAVTEASGRITTETAAAVAATGVHLVSSGWITHSATILDLGLDINPGLTNPDQYAIKLR